MATKPTDFAMVPLAAICDRSFKGRNGLLATVSIIAYHDRGEFGGQGCTASQYSMAAKIGISRSEFCRNIAFAIKQGHLEPFQHPTDKRLRGYRVKYQRTEFVAVQRNESAATNGPYGQIVAPIVAVATLQDAEKVDKSGTNTENTLVLEKKEVLQVGSPKRKAETSTAPVVSEFVRKAARKTGQDQDRTYKPDWSKEETRIAAWQTGILNEIARRFPADKAAEIKVAVAEQQAWALDIWDGIDADIKQRRSGR